MAGRPGGGPAATPRDFPDFPVEPPAGAAVVGGAAVAPVVGLTELGCVVDGAGEPPLRCRPGVGDPEPAPGVVDAAADDAGGEVAVGAVGEVVGEVAGGVVPVLDPVLARCRWTPGWLEPPPL